MAQIEIDAAALARILREEKALPITDSEADRLARAIEASKDNAEFLANALSAIGVLVDQLERAAPEVLNRDDRSAELERIPGGKDWGAPVVILDDPPD